MLVTTAISAAFRVAASPEDTSDEEASVDVLTSSEDGNAFSASTARGVSTAEISEVISPVLVEESFGELRLDLWFAFPAWVYSNVRAR